MNSPRRGPSGPVEWRSPLSCKPVAPGCRCAIAADKPISSHPTMNATPPAGTRKLRLSSGVGAAGMPASMIFAICTPGEQHHAQHERPAARDLQPAPERQDCRDHRRQRVDEAVEQGALLARLASTGTGMGPAAPAATSSNPSKAAATTIARINTPQGTAAIRRFLAGKDTSLRAIGAVLLRNLQGNLVVAWSCFVFAMRFYCKTR